MSKRVKPPKHIMIGAVQYEVAVIKGLKTTGENGETVELFGSQHPLPAKTELEKSMQPAQSAETMLHEISHAVLLNAGVTELVESRVTEAMIQCITQGIVDTLKRNIKLRRWFMNQLEG